MRRHPRAGDAGGSRCVLAVAVQSIALHGSGLAAGGVCALHRAVERVKDVARRVLKIEGYVLEALVRKASEGRARRLHLT
jgi:hypothetical protein